MQGKVIGYYFIHIGLETARVPRVDQYQRRRYYANHLHRFGIIDNPMCPCEEEEEQTVDHLIFKCKKLSNQRNEMTQQIKSNGGNWPTKNETLIKSYVNFL